MAEIYVVEDDESIRELVLYALKNSGYKARGFSGGADFWRAVRAAAPDLALLDIMLPGDDGFRLLERIRENGGGFPVIMLTAKADEYDKVRALDGGADDYITKPFGVMELLSRVRAVLRRAGGNDEAAALRAGDVELDEARHTVTAAGKPVTLTYKEFELLAFLLRNAGLVLSREKLMERVWGFDYEGESRTVDMHVKTLRQKLGSCGTIIETVRGVGYKVTAEKIP